MQRTPNLVIASEKADKWRRLQLAYLLKNYARIGIVGAPHTGKSTLSKLVSDRDVIGTDDFMGIPWEDVPTAVLKRCEGKERYCIEGVMVARALRRGLDLDAVLYLTRPMASQVKGQVAMGKGIDKVMGEWAQEKEPHVVLVREVR